MSEEESNAYLNPKLAGSYRFIDIDIEKEPVYSEIPSEPECSPPQRPKSRRSKSESAFSHELELFVHMRRNDRSLERKNRTKRRSVPGNVFDSKEGVYGGGSGRKSWHQETEGKKMRIFEEINCTGGRQSTIFYEVENDNGLTRSRISLVEKKVLAVHVSRMSLGNNTEDSLPLHQRKKEAGLFQSRLSRVTKTQIFVMVATIMICGITAVLFYILICQEEDSQEVDMASTPMLGTRWTNITNLVKQEDASKSMTALP